MKKILVLIVGLIALSLFSVTNVLSRDTYVRGYTKKDGTYVQPHYRSAPDGDPYNNWSTQGNTNPYTGEAGTHNPDHGYGHSSSPGYGNSYGGGGSLLNNGPKGYDPY